MSRLSAIHLIGYELPMEYTWLTRPLVSRMGASINIEELLPEVELQRPRGIRTGRQSA